MESFVTGGTNVPKLSRPPPVPLTESLIRKCGSCLFSHPVDTLRTLHMPCGCVAVAAGASVISVGLVRSLMSSKVLSTISTVDAHTDTEAALQFNNVASKLSRDALWSINITSGIVTCMSVSVFPGRGNSALGIVGTSQGSLCLFIIETGPIESREQKQQQQQQHQQKEATTSVRLFKVCEVSLGPHSDGLISASDVVVDVCIGFDPAGRPEFVTAASATSVALIDIQNLDESLRVFASYNNNNNNNNQHQYLKGRPSSEPFCASFPSAEVVRVLAPQRHRASFAVDVALVIILDNGVLRYVERRIIGGAVQLLLEHHQQRQARQTEVGLTMMQMQLNIGESEVEGVTFETSCHGHSQQQQQSLPHVLYAYTLSSIERSICARAGSHITVNDATLCYDANTHQMRIILVGAEMYFSQQRQGQPSSPSSLSPRGGGGGWGGYSSSAGAGGKSSSSANISSWWAIAHDVVRVRDTLTQLSGNSLITSTFGRSNSDSLLCSNRGLSSVMVVPQNNSNNNNNSDDALILFACGNELRASTMTELLNNNSNNVTRGGTPLHLHTCGSVISGMAYVDTQVIGKNRNSSAVLVACGASLALLQLN